ncbi:MAG: endonuclease III [Chloroflexi bacterium]|nr:endonuclease III [Chloroflexota bacterium]MCI0580090.1 endonuclease III [Chloroflexota bacterium]MCI0649334.1 endonuclease III [Chloroflexota bacterium]MCI0726030.1 endonuclease III [Chloroflexota bacterium]
MARQSKDPAETYRIIYELLTGHYGRPEWRPHMPPVDQLVNTILSQHTSGLNRRRAFNNLTGRFPDWESVMRAPVEDVAEAIRPAGLANQKAPRIQDALRRIYRERGELNLEFLAEMPLAEAKAWLTSIKGIGPKTAAIILLFAFGRPALPVDTHVHRVTRRLGLIGPKVTADKAHDILENMGDPETYYAFHLNLIRHGRELCTAQDPKCALCPLQAHCKYYQG